MRRLEIPGGVYGECRVDGKYAVLLTNDTIEVNGNGLKPPPGAGGLLFLRVTPRGPFKFAGQSHNGLGNFEYDADAGGYTRVGDSYGINPVIYDDRGRLYQGVLTIGSQGYRYCDGGTLVTGDQTVNDRTPVAKALHVSNLWEWTQLGDVTIGQGANGCVAVYKGVRYMLESGGCYAIRMTRDGDELAITIIKRPDTKAILLWLSAPELATFPLESQPATPPVDGPVPQPKPEPVPVPTVPQSEIDRAKTALADLRYVLGFGADQAPLPYVRAVAQRLGGKWGLNGKRGNANDPSGDILAYDFPGQQPQLFDVLGDGGGANTPQFGALEYPQSAGAVWLSPGAAAPAPSTPSTPGPITGGTTIDLGPILAPLYAKIATLQAAVAVLSQAKQAEQGATQLLDGVRIALKADSGNYLTAAPDGLVSADTRPFGGWQQFVVEVQR